MTRAEQMRAFKAEGHTSKEVADLFGVRADYVRRICKGVAPQSNKNTEDEAAQKIREKSNGLLEYVSGYTIKERPVRVRCLVCGGEFERTFHNLTTKGSVTCPYCVERERLQLKEVKEAERERERKERKAKAQEREAERKRKSEAWKNRPYHECIVCGTLTQNPKYCCQSCRNKANWAAKEHRRRARMKTQMIDSDITVEGLFRRDKGVCAICGKRCDLEDYTVRDGIFIAGDWYPSVDHIKPISKGGLHSWGNVQLAHRRCNTLKSDNEKE